MAVLSEPRDPRLDAMSRDELILTARLVASFIRTTKRDTNPMATADMLVALTDRLEAAPLPEEA